VEDVKQVLEYALLDEKVDNPKVFTIPEEKA
jgi:ATP-dependent Lon protease